MMAMVGADLCIVWCRMMWYDRSLFITTVRDCYEAYVIYCFLHFLVGTLADGLPAANRYMYNMHVRCRTIVHLVSIHVGICIHVQEACILS